MTTSPSSEASYFEQLRTLSEASVTRRFDPYVDIDWESPEFQVDREDPRWVLPKSDPLGAHPWYQALPLDRQIEIGRWRIANLIKVGSQFESLLIRAMQHYAMHLPNGSPEFRYCQHEMIEEGNHILMFQELVNRIGDDVPGMRSLWRLTSPLFPLIAVLPTALFMGILAGEEPIDHMQKELLRSGGDVPAAWHRAMEIHVAEEARHISFAHQFIHSRVGNQHPLQRLALSLWLPLIMRLIGSWMVTPPPEFQDRFDIPDKVMREAFWSSPHSQQVLRNYFVDVRMLANDLDLVNPVSRLAWRALGINGRASRYRSEPIRTPSAE